MLNASAELNALGQLVLMGDIDPDIVQVEVLNDTEMQLRNGSNDIIPITGHTNGATGQETDPIDVSDIPSGQFFIDLGQGNDQLQLNIVPDLDIRVTDSSGDDLVTLTSTSTVASSQSAILSIDADTIRINDAATGVNLANRAVSLNGEVVLGGTQSNLQVDLGSGSLSVDGQITLAGDTTFVGTDVQVDFQQATISASVADSDLTFDLGDAASSSIQLNHSNDSAGQLPGRINVASTHDFSNLSFLNLTGDFHVESSGSVEIVGNVQADEIHVHGDGLVHVTSEIITQERGVLISSDNLVSIENEINTTISGINGIIEIESPTIELTSNKMVSAGGDINVRGPVVIEENVLVDSSSDGQSPGGQIRFFGPIIGTSGSSDGLHVVADESRIQFLSAIGSPSSSATVNSLSVTGDRVEVEDIFISNGNISIDSNLSFLTSDIVSIDGSGSAMFKGALRVFTISTRIDIADDLLFLNHVGGIEGSIEIHAGDSVVFHSSLSEFKEIIVSSGNKLTIDGRIRTGGNVDLSADSGIEIMSPTVIVLGEMVIQDDIRFGKSVIINPTSARFDGDISVDAGNTVRITAQIVDSPVQTEFRKIGEGTLVVSGQHNYTSTTRVDEGEFSLFGALDSTAGQIVVGNGARFTGDADIGAAVDSSGVVAPTPDLATTLAASLAADSFNFSPEARLEIDVHGTVAGDTHDVIIASTTVALNNAVLTIRDQVFLAPATEIVFVQNNSLMSMQGRFRTDVDASGNPLATPRVLNEGDVIFDSFGPDGNRAHITYFGGDGNDVAIIIAGDQSFSVGPTTLVERNAFDVEIRTGNDLADAQSATPIIRPIGSLNGFRLILNATGLENALFVDVDDFIDPSAQLNVDFDIDFNSSSGSNNDQLIVFDSDTASVDSPISLTQKIATSNRHSIEMDASGIGGADYVIRTTNVERFDHQLIVDHFSIELSGADDTVTLMGGGSRQTSVNGQYAGSDYSIDFANPFVSIFLDSGAGNDIINVDSLNPEFRASTSILTGLGNDLLDVQPNLALGSATSEGNVVLEADELRLSVSVDTTLGDKDGSVELIGGVSVTVDSTINAGDSTITLNGNGGTIDASGGNLNAARVHFVDATQVTLGDIQATSVEIGRPEIPIVSVTQAPSTTITATELLGDVTADAILDASDNEIAEIERFNLGGDLTFVNGAAETLITRINADQSTVDVNTGGNILLDQNAIDAGIIVLHSSGSINDRDPNNQQANLIADEIHLTSGIAFQGASGPFEIDAGIGNRADVDVIARQILNASANATNGDIFVTSQAEVLPIGLIDAGAGEIQITADSVEDATDDSITDMISSVLVVSTQNGIGSTNEIEIQNTPDITAETTRGDIRIFIEADSLTLLREVSTGEGDIVIGQRGQQVLRLAEILNGNGQIEIQNDDASIEVGGHRTDDIVRSANDGSLTLRAIGAESDIVIHSLMDSANGDVFLLADRDVNLNAGAKIESDFGVIDITADVRSGSNLHQITMADMSVIDAGDGNVIATTSGDISLGNIQSNSSTDAITLTSLDAGIIDGGDSDLDLIANRGTTIIRTATGVGFDNAIDTDLNILDALVSSAGGISIDEVNQITLDPVITSDGLIHIVSGGMLTANQVLSQNTSSLDQSQPESNRDITLQTQGPSSDILIANVTALAGADASLISSDDIFAIGPNSLIVSDDLSIDASNASGDQNDAVSIFTNVNELEAIVRGENRGDLEITETDSVRLAESDRQDDLEMIATTNGEIRVSAGEHILIVDTNVETDDATLTSDREIFAGGDNGRIRFEASESIDLGDRTQLHADQFAIGSVKLESPTVILGSDFQIGTGDSVGVARIFAPRPDIDQFTAILPDDPEVADLAADGTNFIPALMDVQPPATSFFDFNSIRTNRLEQAEVNDAEGIFTVDVGREGERGLTINIDWGTATDRFQQIDGLSGDAPPLSVKHLYLEGDVLESRLNGRTSATGPLEVRFAVRHHESILVLGDTIQQAESEFEPVDGRVMSSTDNPFTADAPQIPILESGEARFIIPSLSIPVAFFPTRDVIPEIDDPEIVIRSESFIVQTQNSFDVAESSVSASSSREEYFQIRVLSPDPDGEDLVEAKRLPDDILKGDRLRELFSQLPDGRYDLQYVLGDGNVRSILQVDLRDGQPIIRNEALDGGEMRLIPWDGAEESEEGENNLKQNDDGQPKENAASNEPSVSSTLRIEPANEVNQIAEPSQFQTPMAAMMAAALRNKHENVNNVAKAANSFR